MHDAGSKRGMPGGCDSADRLNGEWSHHCERILDRMGPAGPLRLLEPEANLADGPVTTKGPPGGHLPASPQGWELPECRIYVS